MDFTMKSWISPKIWQISWNPADFTMKSTQNLINSDVSAKTLQFGWISHEIWWISPEICQISCEIHPEPYKFRCFSKNSSVWVDFTWNPLDFMKSTRFHTDFMKSGGFHVKSKDLLQGIVTLCLFYLLRDIFPFGERDIHVSWVQS